MQAAFSAISKEDHRGIPGNAFLGQKPEEVVDASGAFAVKADEDVTPLDAGLPRRTIPKHARVTA